MLEEIPLKFSWKFNLSEQGEPKKFESYGPPPNTPPRHNVAVRLCSVSCDFGRTLSDPANSCDGFKGMVNDWVALANRSSARVWSWNYEADDEDFFMPWPDYRLAAHAQNKTRARQCG